MQKISNLIMQINQNQLQKIHIDYERILHYLKLTLQTMYEEKQSFTQKYDHTVCDLKEQIKIKDEIIRELLEKINLLKGEIKQLTTHNLELENQVQSLGTNIRSINQLSCQTLREMQQPWQRKIYIHKDKQNKKPSNRYGIQKQPDHIFNYQNLENKFPKRQRKFNRFSQLSSGDPLLDLYTSNQQVRLVKPRRKTAFQVESLQFDKKMSDNWQNQSKQDIASISTVRFISKKQILNSMQLINKLSPKNCPKFFRTNLKNNKKSLSKDSKKFLYF